jgi:hypothetical protein
MKKDELVRDLHASDWDSANGPVFVKVIAHDVTLWIEIIDIERPGPTVPPWEEDAIVLVSRPFHEKGVRATMPNFALKATSATPVDPAESHYGSYTSSGNGSGRGPEHG